MSISCPFILILSCAVMVSARSLPTDFDEPSILLTYQSALTHEHEHKRLSAGIPGISKPRLSDARDKNAHVITGKKSQFRAKRSQQVYGDPVKLASRTVQDVGDEMVRFSRQSIQQGFRSLGSWIGL